MLRSPPLPASPRALRRGLPAIALAGATALLAACTPTPPVATPPPPDGQPLSHPSATASGAPAAPAPLPVDPKTISVLLVAGPAKLALDGDLAEWGSLDPPREADQTHVAGSHLAVAFRPTDVALALQLGETAKEGVWLTLGDKPPEITKIGDVARGDFTRGLVCEYKQIDAGEGQVVDGPRNLPEVVAACKAMIARHAQLVAKHEERFLRRYRIDRDGVRVAGPGGALTPVEGAQVLAGAADEGGVSLEVSLPLAALPRLVQAPLASIGLTVDLASAPPPPPPTQDGLGHFDLPAPVAFEPWGEVRSRVVALARANTFFPPGLSYQPGDPLHVETFRYPEKDRHSVIPVVESIYEKKATLGDVEVGVGAVYGQQALVILQKGKLLSVVPRDPDLPPADLGAEMKLMGVVARGGELHAFLYTGHAITMAYGFQNPRWYVIAIGPDGGHHPAGDGSADDVWQWVDAWAFTTPEMDTFGVRGITHFPDGMDTPKNNPVGVEIAYRWDPKEKSYTSKKTLIPAPKRPKKSK